MGKGRVEAFTDGVIAIIITIMVLEMEIPAGASFADLVASGPVFFTYVVAFANVGLFWNNHHHMLAATQKIDGRVLWANLFLLFWLSLFPIAIRWMDTTGFRPLPTAAYGVVLICAGIGYMVLQRTIIAADPANAALERSVGADRKAQASLVLDVIAIAVAFWRPWLAIVLYAVVAALWLIPDARIEKTLKA